MRRARLLFLATLPALCPLVAAREEPRTPTPSEVRRTEAVALGLEYLASQQARDGSFGPQDGRVGISALSLLAFMAAGHQENRGAHGDLLRKGVDYLLSRSLRPGKDNPEYSDTRNLPTGYIYEKDDADSRMHGHGYATQVLVLAYGSNRSGSVRARALRSRIQLAVRVIENSQTVTGGWGYRPNNANSHEGSVTVTVVQALRLARDAGFVVDKGVQERGLKYLHRSQKNDGSFKYSIIEERSTPALTAAALTAMHGFGDYYAGAIRRGVEYLEYNYRDPFSITWQFYANYYAAQVFHRAGGRFERLWNRTVVPYILDIQNRRPGTVGGFWDDRDISPSIRAHGRAYATAMSCLALSVTDGYLPLFQR